jgi:hypothetical protein
MSDLIARKTDLLSMALGDAPPTTEEVAMNLKLLISCAG